MAWDIPFKEGIKLIKEQAYKDPPRPRGNLNYCAGYIDALRYTGHLSDKVYYLLLDKFVYGWKANE
jgi:hypothetical protein